MCNVSKLPVSDLRLRKSNSGRQKTTSEIEDMMGMRKTAVRACVRLENVIKTEEEDTRPKAHLPLSLAHIQESSRDTCLKS